jgi:hypothetical protein
MNVSFVQPLSRIITIEDIEKLSLPATYLRVIEELFYRYDQRSREGLSISQTTLAEALDLSKSTVFRALHAASDAGYIMIFDTYTKGVGQTASRYFLTDGIFNTQMAHHAKESPPRISQRHHIDTEKTEDFRPTLIIDKESQRISEEFFPKLTHLWPLSSATVANERDTFDSLLLRLKEAQYRQEGISYIRHNFKEFENLCWEKHISVQQFKETVDHVVSDEGLLATTLWTTNILMDNESSLLLRSYQLKTTGRRNWGDIIKSEIPSNLHYRIPILMS